MMQAMYARFAKEHGLERYTPPPFSMLKYQKEIDRLERAYNQHFNTLWNMVSKAKFALMKRFFETIASRVKHVYDIANRDVESWLKAVMSPLETQVKEHHLQLRRRLDSIKRIHRASGELEERLARARRAAGRGARGADPRSRARSRRDRRDRREPRAAAAGGQRLTRVARLRAARSSWPPSAPSYLRLQLLPASRRVAGLTGMQSTGQTSTHCGVSKWPDALRALRRIDHVDLGALRDRVVRAFGLANVAVDALVGDHQRHGCDVSAARG